MCAPIPLILAGVGLAIQTGSEVIRHAEQQKAHNKNKKAANEAAAENIKLLGLRQQQENDAAKLSIFSADLEARRADAMQRVAAGEAGVTGASIDALISDAERQRLAVKYGIESSVEAAEMQLEAERTGVIAQREARIDAVPKPSLVNTGLRIAGHAVGAAGDYYGNLKDTDTSGIAEATKAAQQAAHQKKGQRLNAEHEAARKRLEERGVSTTSTLNDRRNTRDTGKRYA